MKQIRYGFEALLILIMFVIFRILPLDMASNLGGFLGKRIGVRLATSRKARRNIQRALTLSHADSDKVLSGMWENLGRVMAEYPHLKHIAETRVNITGAAHLQTAIKGGKGAVFIGAHFGNWEAVAPTALMHYHDNVHVTYRAPNNRVADIILSHARTLSGQIKAHHKSRSGGRAMMKALKDGALLGIMIDQKYNQGTQANFFGLPAMTNPFFAQIAQKFDVPVIPVYCKRLNGAHFEMVFEEPLVFDKNTEIIDIIDTAHARLESWIEDSPEQWLWLHRRWKKD